MAAKIIRTEVHTMLKCPNCGADIPFNPATQTYICEFCSSEFTQEQLNEAQLSGDIKAEE